MREDPGLDVGKISACLDAHYDLHVASITFLPIGYDLNAAVYEVISCDGGSYFLKIRFDPVHEPGLLVPQALSDLGVRNVLAPLRTPSLDLWCPLDGYPGYSAVLYPFVSGENAVSAGLTVDQWRTFGSTLRAVHDSGLGERLRGRLPVETFSLPSAASVRQLLDLVNEEKFEGPAAARLAVFWREYAGQIRHMLARAETLGRSLRTKPFELVLCHADIHAANVLVDDDGRIHLIDWDGPLVGPRERDLLFVVGSKIARAVEPREEELFFEGYGPVEIDPEALIYFRYERVIEDFGEFGKSVLFAPGLGEHTRAEEAELVMNFFRPGGIVETIETVTAHRSQNPRSDAP
jgi:spectinomycin phosphotransferase